MPKSRELFDAIRNTLENKNIHHSIYHKPLTEYCELTNTYKRRDTGHYTIVVIVPKGTNPTLLSAHGLSPLQSKIDIVGMSLDEETQEAYIYKSWEQPK